jgi:hypothetical protein
VHCPDHQGVVKASGVADEKTLKSLPIAPGEGQTVDDWDVGTITMLAGIPGEQYAGDAHGAANIDVYCGLWPMAKVFSEDAIGTPSLALIMRNCLHAPLQRSHIRGHLSCARHQS